MRRCQATNKRAKNENGIGGKQTASRNMRKIEHFQLFHFILSVDSMNKLTKSMLQFKIRIYDFFANKLEEHAHTSVAQISGFCWYNERMCCSIMAGKFRRMGVAHMTIHIYATLPKNVFSALECQASMGKGQW